MLPIAAHGQGGPADVRVITHAGHSAQKLHPNFLRGIFTLRISSWPDGEPVRVFVLPDQHPTHKRFVREYLGTYPYVVRDIWEQVSFTGTGLTPTVVETEEEMRRRVRNTRGAIGYVSIQTGPQSRIFSVRMLVKGDGDHVLSRVSH